MKEKFIDWRFTGKNLQKLEQVQAIQRQQMIDIAKKLIEQEGA